MHAHAAIVEGVTIACQIYHLGLGAAVDIIAIDALILPSVYRSPVELILITTCHKAVGAPRPLIDGYSGIHCHFFALECVGIHFHQCVGALHTCPYIAVVRHHYVAKFALDGALDGVVGGIDYVYSTHKLASKHLAAGIYHCAIFLAAYGCLTFAQFGVVDQYAARCANVGCILGEHYGATVNSAGQIFEFFHHLQGLGIEHCHACAVCLIAIGSLLGAGIQFAAIHSAKLGGHTQLGAIAVLHLRSAIHHGAIATAEINKSMHMAIGALVEQKYAVLVVHTCHGLRCCREARCCRNHK